MSDIFDDTKIKNYSSVSLIKKQVVTVTLADWGMLEQTYSAGEIMNEMQGVI